VADLEACLAFYRSYCGLKTVHEREAEGKKVVWLAEEGSEERFVLVFIPGGPRRDQAPRDFSHLGFALDSRAQVDALAARAARAWPVVDDAYPVGYYCGVRDPDGRVVEFSHGQPLGPGAESTKRATLS
jgi:catechol 2,3-dioxygenase-like lactoylglutathione lyase family enzyme